MVGGIRPFGANGPRGTSLATIGFPNNCVRRVESYRGLTTLLPDSRTRIVMMLPVSCGAKTLIIYHHLGRENHELHMRKRLRHLRERLEVITKIRGLPYCRGSGRAFFVIPARRYDAVLAERINRFLKFNWREHFSV